MRRPYPISPGLALAALALAAASGCGGGGEPAAPVPPAADDAPGRVLLVGLDGADWAILDRLQAASRVPHLARLRREGAWGVLRSESPLLSPIVWTTIATSRHPLDHGIVGFLTVRDGRTEPVRSDERRVPAFWNVASAYGVPVGVVGWYATWPAEQVRGFMLSDRVGQHQVSGDGERAGTALVYPESLLPEVAAARERIERGIGADAAARFFSSAGADGGALVSIEREKLDAFLGILRTTELYRALTPRLMERFEPRITAVYFEGTDAVGHLFAEYADPPLPGVDPGAAAHLGVAVDRFYAYIDTVLGELAATLDPRTDTLVVVSDHGFRTGEARPRTPTRGEHGDQAPRWHRPEGVVLLWGRGIRRGVELPESAIADVVPTLFRLVGLPISLELRGRPIDAALDPELLRRPVRSVDDYALAGTGATLPAEALPADEVMAKLRALGYVGSALPAPSPVSEPGRVAAFAGQASLPLNRYNVGVILMGDGRLDEALQVFRALQRDVPDYPLGYLGEATVLLRQRRPAEAARRLEASVARGHALPAIHATLAEAYRDAGREAEALGAFRRALELGGTDGPAALLLGQERLAARDLDGAAPLLETARRFADAAADRAAACVGLAVIAEERGAWETAAARYDEALGLRPGLAAALERYGNLELYRGRTQRGIELLRRLVEASDGDGRAWALYARGLSLAGRGEEAREAARRALEREPDSPEVRRLVDGLAPAPG